MPMPGGYFETLPDARVAKAEEVAIDAIKEQYGGDVTVEKVERQVVAGTNYRIHLRAGDTKYLVVVFESLPINETTFTVSSVEKLPDSTAR
ncbi:hypothetical protein ASPVEDRAFT_89808 [Aspergillus versicolor CBS 583.65]|uniref:Cystatin domain-containing protein n=1 Tax=Aspergillus versicolor CBS 583.65 TaxID=1036611 RepID=A0A1L9Q4C3_ASPVE|nr:uncharacterized protein ASPVEDRAFT_89808 [Aspergillus versicolor CBS 583.65]OJJ08596.1 hypothetical protein ASPVEDRAFT_89808 [Aspergillus versicolor CBS 583.65]